MSTSRIFKGAMVSNGNSLSSKVSLLTADFNIVYERISCRPLQNHCTCKQTGFEYPEYAAKELALFRKLQSGWKQHPSEAIQIPVPTEVKNPLGIEASTQDTAKNVSVPDKDSDLMDCEVLWVGPMKSSDSGPDHSAQKLDANGNLKAVSQSVKHKECDPPNSPIEKPKHEPVFDVDLLPSRNLELRKKIEKKVDIEPGEIFPYQCQICSYSLASYSDLKVHLSNHAKMSKEYADIYRQSLTLLEHLIFGENTGKQRKQSCCKICNKIFITVSDLREHMGKFHVVRRPFKCTKCRNTYTCRSHLLRHELRKHVNEKNSSNSRSGRPFQCVLCPKNYTRRHHLIRHKLNKHDIQNE